MSSVAAGLSALDRLDRLARLDTPVHRVDPRAKVVTTLVFVVCVVSCGKYDLLGLLPFALFPVVLATEGGLPLGFLGRLLLIASPFALVMGAFNPLFDREVVAYIGSVPRHRRLGLVRLDRRCASCSPSAAALVLTATTGFTGVCLALEKLKVPGRARHPAAAAVPLHLRARRRGAPDGAGAAPAQLRAPRHGLARVRPDARPAAPAHVRAGAAHLPGDEVPRVRRRDPRGAAAALRGGRPGLHARLVGRLRRSSASSTSR